MIGVRAMIISIKRDTGLTLPTWYSLWLNGKWASAGPASLCLANLRILLSASRAP